MESELNATFECDEDPSENATPARSDQPDQFSNLECATVKGTSPNSADAPDENSISNKSDLVSNSHSVSPSTVLSGEQLDFNIENDKTNIGEVDLNIPDQSDNNANVTDYKDDIQESSEVDLDTLAQSDNNVTDDIDDIIQESSDVDLDILAQSDDNTNVSAQDCDNIQESVKIHLSPPPTENDHSSAPGASASGSNLLPMIDNSLESVRPDDVKTNVESVIEDKNGGLNLLAKGLFSNAEDGGNRGQDSTNNSTLGVIDTSMFPKPPPPGDEAIKPDCFEFESNPAGPSDDREDISDEEFQDLDSSNPTNHTVPQHPTLLNLHSGSGSVNSSEVGDIIDLKFEDTALKSIASSCDTTEDNKQSKESGEDLENVSDEELPNVPHVTVSNTTNSIFLDDREEVSSSEDEDTHVQRFDATPISSGDEFPTSQNEDEPSSDLNFFTSNSVSGETVMKPLDAEPISDEEDHVIANLEEIQADSPFDDGEAGEIKSPAIGSPISDGGDAILEVEPVSADESPDTDGELPSGDEAEKDGDKKFESIDSDDDIAGNVGISNIGQGKSLLNKDNDDMENISDEENLGDPFLNKDDMCKNTITVSKVERNVEKGRNISSSFNEHQVELDYEEGYGEDGDAAKPEVKEEEAKKVDVEKDDGECEDQGDASDKDEGELSDDDCEEGEIKEPGSKKMFIKPMCRFFQRGHCTWGISCRFLHPGVNDKGNYQMIEIPGFKPQGVRARLGIPGQFTEQQPPQEELEELPPPPMPDVPRVETAWERGLRIAKEQRKKASERKEKEPDFDEKRLNLSVDEEKELNKENERTTPRIIPKDPYYDQQAYEVDEYYKIPRDPWHTGHYENFEVRYHQNSYSPPSAYRVKPPAPPPPVPPIRYNRPLSPPVDKFGRHREDRPMPPPPERHEPLRVSDYPPPVTKHPDEWVDPWQRSKSPKQQQRKARSRSRGRRGRRSLSSSSNSSRSDSRSSSGSSRSSRSGSSSSSSSRSRSPEPAPPGVDRMERQDRYGNDQPRSMVSVRDKDNRGGFNRYDNYRYQNRGGGHAQGFGGYSRSRNPNFRQDLYNQGGRGGGGSYYNNYNRGGRGGANFNHRDPRGRQDMPPRGRPVTPDRPLPYTRPRKSRSSSRSSSSRSRSRSRSKSSDSSRSSSNSSRSSSSSSSSGGSADSDHLYRDLGSPSKTSRHPSGVQKKRHGVDPRKERISAKNNHISSSQSSSRRPPVPPPTNMERPPLPPGRSPPPLPQSRPDPKYSQIPLPLSTSGGGSSRVETKYSSRNAPQPPVKPKDPLKVVGQKSNIKLTLLPKQQQPTLGDRPNPLASPPHKRRLSDRDSSPTTPPPSKRPNVSMQASSLRVAQDRAAKLARADKAKSPPPGSLPPPPLPPTSIISSQRSKNPPVPGSPPRQTSGKLRPVPDAAATKPASKASSGALSNPQANKSKKSMSSRREELLKQLKAVEDAIARKKVKMS